MPGLIHHHAVIHPKAHVARDECFIGAGTKVWQFASVIRGARLGDDCVVGAGAVIDGAQIGDGCLIGSGALINPGITIGDGVFVGPGVIFCNDMWPSVSKEGFDLEEIRGSIHSVIVVESGASIGAGAIILPGSRIGFRTMIAAGAVISGMTVDDAVHRRDGEWDHKRGDEKRMRWAD